MNQNQTNHGVVSTVESLRETLNSYIEAQYHIANEQLISERRSLLSKEGTTWQRPYIESTPVYKLGKAFNQLSIPTLVAELLTELSCLGGSVEVFQRPYEHQATALEKFFDLESPKDIVIATGTGSGKTEGFLYPIIGHLALEA